MPTAMTRRQIAADRLAQLLDLQAGESRYFAQRLDNWLQAASAKEVRKHWDLAWGRLPEWATEEG